jgi:L,D-peptidoglycan transpeptidase YkuD (ErfK/YbiS/YcfS/YnhG family)
MYGLAPDPGVRFRYHRLVCGDWWDEDPSSPTYNTFEHVSCNARPRFGGDGEALWRQAVAYRLFAVIDYNTQPAVAGRGSAMFVHADTGSATNGCVSLPLTRLVTLLRWLAPSSAPRISIRVQR